MSPIKLSCPHRLVALLGILLVVCGSGRAAELKSVSRIAFGPDNVLFAADWKAAKVVSFTLAAPAQATSAPYNLLDFESLMIKAVGSTEIRVEDLKARPDSSEVYVAISVGPERRPVLVSVLPDGTTKVLNVHSLKAQEVNLKDAPEGDYKFWGKIPERSFTTTDMQWHDGKLYVAGLSNQNFASTLRVIEYPFDGKQTSSSIEIYHTSHDEIETRAPIRTMAFTTLDGKDYLIAAYMCTPLVTIPIEDIKDGAHLRGKTIAELGYGNTPASLLTFTASEQGKNVDYVLVSNVERNAEAIPLSQIQAANAKDSLAKFVAFGMIEGVQPVQTPMAGVYRIDNQNDKFFVALRRDLATGHSQLISYDKNFRFRLSDFVSEYNFPGYTYEGQVQVGYIKPVEDQLKKEEGYPVTTSNSPNGPFIPKK